MTRSAANSALSSVLSSSLSSVIFAVLPKCPACLVLLLAPIGIRLPYSSWFLAYALLMLAGIPLVFFLTPVCRRSCGMRPLFLALAGLLVMTVGRVSLDSNILVAVGAMALVGSSFWTARSALILRK